MEAALTVLEENAFAVAAVVALLVVAVGVTMFMGGPSSRVDVADVADIPRGTMKEVALPGSKDKVLVVHTNKAEFKALSAKCPHKGAPMVKGVLSGDCVTCPWHAARFNVGTGDIEDGPVCDALHAFPTTVSGGRVFVDLPKGADGKPCVPSKRTPDMAARAAEDGRHFIIVGGGAAGSVAAETLRAEGFQGKITMVSKEADLPYDRTALSKTFQPSGDNEPTLLRTAEFLGKHGVNVLTGTIATALDTAERSLAVTTLASGATSELQFDKLLIATGGAARAFKGDEHFTIPGAGLRGIFVLRDASDIRGITAALAMGSPGKNVVVVGSSFIGMEAAAYLAKRTKPRGGRPAEVSSVRVVGMETEPFERVLGSRLGAIVRGRAEKEGVVFNMKDTVSEFLPHDNDPTVVGEVELKSGENVDADIIIVGAGIIPATGWLQSAAGITLQDPRKGGGVLCDEFLCAHDSRDVFVAGDVANFPYAQSLGPDTATMRIEHYDVAMDHGRVAARNMLDKRVSYDVIPFFWTGLFGMSIRYAGHARTVDSTVWVEGAPVKGKPVFTAYYVTGDVISGVASVNDDPKAVAALELFRAGKMPSPAEVEAAEAFDPVAFLAQVNAAAASGAGE